MAPWPVPNYTARWQRHTGVSSFPKATMQRCLTTCKRLNPWGETLKSDAIPIAPTCRLCSDTWPAEQSSSRNIERKLENVFVKQQSGVHDRRHRYRYILCLWSNSCTNDWKHLSMSRSDNCAFVRNDSFILASTCSISFSHKSSNPCTEFTQYSQPITYKMWQPKLLMNNNNFYSIITASEVMTLWLDRNVCIIIIIIIKLAICVVYIGYLLIFAWH